MAKQQNEAKIRFTAETGEFNKEIQDANNSMRKLRGELRLNDAEMKDTGESAEKLARKQEILGEEAKASQKKIDALSDKLEVAREIFGDNSKEVDRLENQLLNAKTAHVKLTSELKKTTKQLDKEKKAAKQADTQLEKLTREIQDQESELEDLRRKYANVVLEQGEASTEAKTLATRITNLNGDLEKNQQKLKDAKTAANNLGTAFRNSAADASEAANGGYTVAKDVLADFVTNAIETGVSKLQEFGIEYETLMTKFQNQTGTSTEDMGKYADVMDRVYSAGYGESFEDVSAAMGTVVQVMGEMPDDQLEVMTANALTLSETFGWDVNESVRACNSMMDQFGISSQDAFDLMVQGAQNGLNQNGDMLDIINEYSKDFEAAGYSADEMFRMLENGSEKGVWNIDKMGDAMKEYNIRMTDGTANEALEALGLDVDEVTGKYAQGGEAAQEATGQVISALKSVEDPQERYMLGQQIMGTMWEDLGEEAVFAMFDTEGAIDSANEAMSGMNANKMDDVGTKLSQLGRSFETEIVQPINEKVMPVIGGFADWCVENFDIVKGVVLGVGGAFLVLGGYLAITGLISGVTKAFAILNAVMAANPVMLVVLAIAALVGVFIYFWNTSEGFREFWTNLWATIQEKFWETWENIKNIPEFFGTIFSEIGRRISEWWTGFKEGVAQKWEEIKATISEKWESIKTTISEKWESFKSVFNWDNIKTAASTKWEEIKTTLSTKWEGVKTAASTKWSEISTGISTAWENVKTAASTKWEEIKSTLGTKWEEVKTTVGTKASELGVNLGLAWDNLKTTAGTKWEDIKTTLGTKWEDIKTGVGTKASELGTNLGIAWDNVKTTADTKWQEVKTFMQDPVGNAATAIGGFLADIGLDFSGFDSASIDTLFQSISGFMSDPIGTAKDTISGFITDIQGFFDGLDFELPDIKLPHFNVSVPSWNPLDWVDPALRPSLSVEWYAKGGVMTSPTIFGMGPNGLLGGGEYPGAKHNPELVTPQSLMRETFDETLSVRLEAQGLALASEIEALGDHIVEAIGQMGIYVDKRQLGKVMTEPINRNMGRLATKGGF